jgi:hypothetical protein
MVCVLRFAFASFTFLFLLIRDRTASGRDGLSDMGRRAYTVIPTTTAALVGELGGVTLDFLFLERLCLQQAVLERLAKTTLLDQHC